VLFPPRPVSQDFLLRAVYSNIPCLSPLFFSPSYFRSYTGRDNTLPLIFPLPLFPFPSDFTVWYSVPAFVHTPPFFFEIPLPLPCPLTPLLRSPRATEITPVAPLPLQSTGCSCHCTPLHFKDVFSPNRRKRGYFRPPSCPTWIRSSHSSMTIFPQVSKGLPRGIFP